MNGNDFTASRGNSFWDKSGRMETARHDHAPVTKPGWFQ
jgi:hypothetical protein